jgi:predicted oxidoreductase
MPHIDSGRLIYGCMALGGGNSAAPLSVEDVKRDAVAVDAALEAGIRTFDHADIYRHGKAEESFGRILKSRPDLRSQIRVQTKCGIRLDKGGVAVQYDLSSSWVREAVDASLRRLRVEFLDVLILHRPDPLMDPAALASTLETLVQSGKVGALGVSNMPAGLVRRLQRELGVPIAVNQLEMSLANPWFVEQELNVDTPGSLQLPLGSLDLCAEFGLQVQAWGSLARGVLSGAGDSSGPYASAATYVAKLASEKATSPESVVLGWLLKHPSRIHAVIGTTNPDRIRACADAERQADEMTRDEWYGLLAAVRGAQVP